MRPRRSWPLLVLLALLAPASALAAHPRPAAIVEDHRHFTGGHDWHVQVEVNRRGTRLESLLVWSQRCDATGWVLGVPVSSTGAFSVDRKLPGGKGRFTIAGRFATPDRANGTWSVTTADCTDGKTFRAQDATGHFLIGNPYEYAPPRIRGTSRQARAL